MPFDGRSKVRVDAQARSESARETIAALDHLAALFEGVNDNAPSFASLAYVIGRARELAAAEADRQP